MRVKITRTALAMACWCIISTITTAQEVPLETRRQGVDPNNAQIEGRILLPSGRTADFNVKVILSELHRPLITTYTNKHAEFQFQNLRAGEYYIRVIADEKIYEPVTNKVWVSRSQTYQLTIMLRKKEEVTTTHTGGLTVSASELEQAVPAAARKEYEQGAKLAGKGNLREAIVRFRRALDIYPDYIAAHNDLGAQYLKLKQFDRATEQFRLALERNPKYFNSLFNLALVMIETRDYAEAITQLNRAIAVDGTRYAAQFWLGIARLNSGDLPGAERALSKSLITGGGNFVAAHFYLAQVHLKGKNESGAIRELKAYLEEAPKGEFAEEARRLLTNLTAKATSTKTTQVLPSTIDIEVTI